MVSVSVVEYGLMYLCIRRWELILYCFIQSIYCIFMFFAFSVPSLIFPYYEYSNINELLEYADRKKINEAIEPILILGVNSIMAVPVAMYISEFITYETFMMTQFLVMPVILVILMITMLVFISKFIESKEYLNKIYRSV